LAKPFSPEAAGILQRYPWPGNVRKMENVIERAMILSSHEHILPQDLPFDLTLNEPTTSGFLSARRGGPTPELEKLRKDCGKTVQFLADHQVDFDLADEDILEWFGKIESRKPTVGKATDDLLVWPANMINLRHQTLPLLARYFGSRRRSPGALRAG
jgi:hypothetical protein